LVAGYLPSCKFHFTCRVTIICEVTIARYNECPVYIVTCFESRISEVAFLGQQIWNFIGNQLVEAHIHGNAQATETELLEIDIYLADFL
jgi:hypothetical protein